MHFRSWGNFPKIESQSLIFDSHDELRKLIDNFDDLISYGNGRSYGDSALNKNIINVLPQNYFLNFDKNEGLLHVQAGALLSEIIDVYVPNGWFLKITPGTKLITVGGAIASDVHGKNHHVAGCFSECVQMFNLMLPSGKVIKCSRSENFELFKATCGGMGLTGVILDAKFYLQRINSKFINQTTIKTKNLVETFEAFEKYGNKPYSVAWIDCLAKKDEIGRCLLMVGDFNNNKNLNYKKKATFNLPFNLPSYALNTSTVKMFNHLYYNRVREKITRNKIDINSFFYPLDSIGKWNRIYGKNGFIQYQFILPIDTSFIGLEKILQIISESGKGSFLAVLKLYGKANENYLSFPMEGYSLALDFKMEKGLFSLLDSLDEIVLENQGRIYLAKDARVSKSVFEKGYPQVDKFRELRREYKMNVKFNSIQSKRLGI